MGELGELMTCCCATVDLQNNSDDFGAEKVHEAGYDVIFQASSERLRAAKHCSTHLQPGVIAERVGVLMHGTVAIVKRQGVVSCKNASVSTALNVKKCWCVHTQISSLILRFLPIGIQRLIKKKPNAFSQAFKHRVQLHLKHFLY